MQGLSSRTKIFINLYSQLARPEKESKNCFGDCISAIYKRRKDRNNYEPLSPRTLDKAKIYQQQYQNYVDMYHTANPREHLLVHNCYFLAENSLNETEDTKQRVRDFINSFYNLVLPLNEGDYLLTLLVKGSPQVKQPSHSINLYIFFNKYGQKSLGIFDPFINKVVYFKLDKDTLEYNNKRLNSWLKNLCIFYEKVKYMQIYKAV